MNNFVRSPKGVLLLLFLCCVVLVSCARIPEPEQLVSAGRDLLLTRSNGSCTEEETVDSWLADTSLPELSPDSISIFSWNIYKGQRQNWDVDFLLFSEAKDIIFLQEATITEELQEVLQQKELKWHLNSAFKYKGTDTGVLVASTIQSTGSCGLRHKEPLIGVPKTILVNTYGISGSNAELLVANIHGINITLGTSAYQAQLDGLERILERHNGPIILAGDFNNWTMKRTEIMMQLAEKLSLQILSFDEGGRTLFFGDPVDQILYRGLVPVSQAVYPVTSSDHNPIAATFRLASPQTVARSVSENALLPKLFVISEK